MLPTLFRITFLVIFSQITLIFSSRVNINNTKYGVTKIKNTQFHFTNGILPSLFVICLHELLPALCRRIGISGISKRDFTRTSLKATKKRKKKKIRTRWKKGKEKKPMYDALDSLSQKCVSAYLAC